MNTIKYQAFLEAADCGSLTKAAAKLNYTQPAISHMIRTLEKEYGFPLLLRASDRVVPTREAERIIPYLRGILHNEQSLYEETNLIKQVEVGHINIGTYVSVMSSFLPALIQDFVVQHPAIDISLVEGNTAELNAALKNRAVDFAFASKLGFEDFDFLPLMKDELFVVLPERHPLCEKERISPQELFQYPIISTELNSECDLVEISRLAGVEPKIRMRTKIETSILALVACNIGVAIIPSLYLWKHPKGVAIRKLDSPWNSREIGLLTVSPNDLSPASRQFINCMPEDFEVFIRNADSLPY